MTISFLPLAIVFIPLFFGILIFFVSHEQFKLAFALSASLFGLFLTSLCFKYVTSGYILTSDSFILAPDIVLLFRIDALSLFFALITTFLWVLTVLFSVKYMEGNLKKNYWAFLTLSTVSALGVYLGGNLITLFLFFEFLTLFTYPLVIYAGTDEAQASGGKYLLYLLAGEVFLLFAVVATISFGGGSFSKIGMLSSLSDFRFLRFLLLAYVLGFGIKTALFPLHRWLIGATVAPTPVTGLLHAVAVVNTGIYGLIRVVYHIFGLDLISALGVSNLLLWIASLTIIFGSVAAFRQDDLKKRLAYSTIAHISYTLLGVSVLNANGLVGGLIHLASHALAKLSLFFCAGKIYKETGKTKVSELSGLGYQMPLTLVFFTVASLALIGVPLTLGFLSKWYLWMGPLETQRPLFILVLVISTLLCAFYLLPIVSRAFFRSNGKIKIKKVSWFYLLPIGVTSLSSLFFGVFPTIFLNLTRQIVQFFLGG